MTAAMVFCVMSTCCAAAQLAIGIAAAVNDRSRSDTGELSRERYYLRNDIYYERNDPFIYLYPHYCTGSEGAFTWVSHSGCIIAVKTFLSRLDTLPCYLVKISYVLFSIRLSSTIYGE